MTARTVRINDKGLRVGQDHHLARLTDREVDHLLELKEAGWGYKRLAKKFEISVRHVRAICSGSRRCQTGTGFRVLLPG